jgi:drug/metabolite transporter (DMT)-like permease
VPEGAGGAVVALGLGAALTWGAADFGGGLASRRAHLFGVTLAAPIVGLVAALAIAVARGEAVPGPEDVAWSAASGAFGAIGIVALYGGLAAGRMGVVAPVTGVLAATVPVVVGFALEGLPGSGQVVGIGLAIVAVVLVSRAADAGPDGRPSGLSYGVAAGLGLGLLAVTLSRVSDGLVFGPLAILRGVQIALIATAIVVARRPWRLERRMLPAVAAVGLLDMAGNGLFLAAAQVGPLAIAAVLSSLYPVTTVILATAVLRERLGRGHAVGIVCALSAIVLIAAGSAG